MKTILFYFLTAIPLLILSCKKDDTGNSLGSKLTIVSVDPKEGSTLTNNQTFRYEIKYYVGKKIYEADATYKLEVFLKGSNSEDLYDCGSTIISVPDSREGTAVITGTFDLLFDPPYNVANPPYEVEIVLAQYSKNETYPMGLAEIKINYK
jgi:hypothetical protein